MNYKSKLIILIGLICTSLSMILYLSRPSKNRGEVINNNNLVKPHKTKAEKIEGKYFFPKGYRTQEEVQDIDDKIQFTASSIEDVKEIVCKFTKNLYTQFSDMDFSQAVPGEIIFVRNNHPIENKSGYYIVTLRNDAGELMARATMDIISINDYNIIIEANNVEPFAPAYTDQKVQDKYRGVDNYPLKLRFPFISENQAKEVAKQKFSKGDIKSNGLTNLYVFLPSINDYYEIGSKFVPYYELSINGENIWVNSETGDILDQTFFNSQLSEFEAEMKSNSTDPSEE